jgi:hypothetical protein
MPRGLLPGSLDVTQKSHKLVDVRPLGVVLQVGELVEMKNLVPISTYDEDDKIADPSREPDERFLSEV